VGDMPRYFYHLQDDILILLLREVVWVFWTNFEQLSSVVVVAVGMWSTRLRCPSCAQRSWVLMPWICDEAAAPADWIDRAHRER
jgi:hypothetical protein